MRPAVTFLVPLAALVAPAAARAADGGRARAGRDRKARELVDQSLDAAQAGDRDRAYKLAREAYLDHFEFVEIPLRLRNPNLVLDTEFEFAKLRNDIKDGASLSELDDVARRARGGLADVDRELADKGVAAPLIAFGFSFTILFREGVEAVLLIAILLGSLDAGGAANYRRPLALGRRRRARRDRPDLAARDARDRHRAAKRELLEAVTALSRSSCSSRVASGSSRGSSTGAGWSSCARAWRARWRRGRGWRSSGSGSPPSTARASRPCSSTRRSRCSPRA